MTQDEGGAALRSGRVSLSLGRRIGASMFWRVIVANLYWGGLALAVFLLGLDEPIGPATQGDAVLTAVLVTAGLGLPAYPFVYFRIRRLTVDAVAWVDDDRSPTVDERRRVLFLPLRVVGTVTPFYAIIAIVITVIAFRYYDVHYIVRTGFVYVATITAGATLTFIAARSGMRELYALTLAEPSDIPTRLGLLFRIMLVLGVTFSIPVGLAIAVPQRFGLAAIQWVAVSAGFLQLGGLLFAIVTSVTRPLGDIEQALGRVEAGDLDATVTVSDDGELGRVQLAVNKMVQGLREREHLRDLFGRHVGEDVARHALETETGLGGQTLQASVLFVDVVGSTGLAESRPPDEVVVVLNRFFDVVGRVIAAEGGDINQFHGDGAMCVFGAPDEQPDHAARALRAARAIAANLGEIDAGIGVSSGTVVSGNLGTERRYAFTVVGDPVNEASRLCDEGKLRQSHVAVSGKAVALAPDEASNWIPTGPLQLRGRRSATEVYEPRA